MAAEMTFKIPTQKDGILDATGYVMLIPINGKKVKFILQDVPGSESCNLTHYASGMIAVHETSVSAAKLTYYCANPYSTPLTNRETCARLIKGIINQIGAENLLKKLEAAKVINF